MMPNHSMAIFGNATKQPANRIESRIVRHIAPNNNKQTGIRVTR